MYFNNNLRNKSTMLNRTVKTTWNRKPITIKDNKSSKINKINKKLVILLAGPDHRIKILRKVQKHLHCNNNLHFNKLKLLPNFKPLAV